MKKLALILILALPFIAAAADEGHATITPVTPITTDNLDWIVPHMRGFVIEVSGDSVSFQERWMHLLPGGGAITSKSNQAIDISAIPVPSYGEISYGGKGKEVYIIELHLLTDQLQTNSDGDVLYQPEPYEK
jgi:hypothetical protein